MNNHTYNKLDDILQAEYKRGYEEGYAARKEADQGDNSDYYRQGLEEAWELVDRLATSKEDGGFSLEEFEKIFGTVYLTHVLGNFTAQEAIEKIKEYEAEQKRKEEEMKTLDEAILHVSEVARTAREGRFTTPDVKDAAEEYEQYEAWLRELKARRDQDE